MSAGTKITYNGITIQDVLTEGINQAFQFDSTGVDPLFLRTTIKCIGTIILDPDLIDSNVDHGILVKPGNSVPSVPYLMERMFQPRRRFTMSVCNWVTPNLGGAKIASTQTWFDVKPGATIGSSNSGWIGPGWDVNNGPKVSGRFYNITPLSVKVELTIELCLAVCDSSYPGYHNGVPIINFRFWIGEDIDGRTHQTRRTYQGRLRIANRSENIHEALRANFLIPPIQPGFHRESISIQESSDGLTLDFTVVDQEVYASAPAPGITWEGNHRVSTAKPGGAVINSEVNITVTGAKGTDKKALIVVAQRVIEAKLHVIDFTAQESAFLQSASYNDHFTSSRVDASARIKHTNLGKEPILFGVWADNLGGSLHDPTMFDLEGGYDRMRPVGIEQSATTVGLFRSALQDPCHPASMPNAVAQLQKWEPEEAQGEDSPGDEQTEIPPTEVAFTEAQDKDPHTIYLLSSRIQTATGVVRFPLSFDPQYGEYDPPSYNASLKVKMHSARAVRFVDIEAQRLMKPPSVLSPVDFTDENDIEHNCRSWDYEVVAPILSADGRKTLHQINGRVIFDLNRPPDLSSEGGGLPGCKLPYMTAEAQPFLNIPPSFFVKGGDVAGAGDDGPSVI